jgi:anti-sigma B factor antagonist
LQPFRLPKAAIRGIEDRNNGIHLYAKWTQLRESCGSCRAERERGQRLKSHESTPSSHLAIAIDRSGMEVIIRLNGRIDVDSSPDIRDSLLDILSGKQSVHAVTVDLSDVNHIEASGIATLVEALKIAKPRQIRLHLRGLHGSVLRLFEVTGLLPLFETIHGGKGVA